MSRIVVTGPPGSGTTLVAAALAARLRVRFIDGAELYPTGARARSAGDPREVWLDALALSFAREGALVVASGSLTRGLRDLIRQRVAGVAFAEIVVETPVNLTKRQQELLREFEDAGNGTTHPESEGFFARVKELWDELRD